MKCPSDRWQWGEEMKRLRRERGLSIRDAAELAGLSHQSVLNVEKSHKEPRLGTLLMMAKLYNVRICIDEQASDASPQ